MKRFVFAIVILIVTALAIPVAARMYKWVDDDGNVHFTDNLYNVPGGESQSGVSTVKAKAFDKESLIPLEDAPAGYVVKVTLNRRRDIRLILDTGATSTVISPKILRDLGSRISMDPPIEVLTAGGKVKAGRAYLNAIKVGGFEKSRFEVIALDAIDGADGLLGMDFLGDYRVEILSSGPTLKLTP